MAKNNNRITMIMEYIQQKKEVTVRELCDQFPNVTEMTIRRDLNVLQDSGIVRRIWGGAKLNEEVIDEKFSQTSRAMCAQTEKQILARKALSLITSPTSIFLDAGTTTLELAKVLPTDLPIFVLTNNPDICMELRKHDNCEVLITGGKLSKTVSSLTGPVGLHAFENINIDIAFIAAMGVSPMVGFTNAHQGECLLKQKAIECASTKVMLVDSSKMNAVLPYTICGFECVDMLVTDRTPPLEIQKACEAVGVRIVC